MTALAVVAGELRLRGKQRAELNRRFLPWALHAGATAPDLICLYYEKHFEASTAPISYPDPCCTALAAPSSKRQ